MRLVHVVPHVGHAASGPSYSVPRLCQSLGQLGNEVSLLTLERGQDRKDQAYEHLSYRETAYLGLGLSPSLRRAVNATAKTADIVHAHSLWLMPNVYPAWAARRAGKPLVLSPRGTLSPVALARSRWRKRLFWYLLQKRAVTQARLLHATSEQEYRDIRAAGLTQPVAIIPNGIDIPAARPPPSTSNGTQTLLYLGRLHPIKGLEMLLQAWARLQSKFPNWELKLVGPDEGEYSLKLKQLAASLKLERIVFAGPLYGAQKDAAYAMADLYVLPSFSENFGMSVAEALAQGVPVVTTTGTPWERLEKKSAGWCVAPETAALEAALGTALAMPADQLRRMGSRGRAWMEQDFSWEHVARQMQAAYRWILQSGPVPDCVRLS